MKTTENIVNDLIDYFSGDENPFYYASTEILKVLAEGQKLWDDAPCDEEGATPEQNKYLDEILFNTATKIKNIIECQ